MASEELAGGKLILDFPAEAVVRITISNPERRNALDHEILDTLAETLPRLDSGIENRCVLITGAPPVFSAGYDIGSIPEQTFERDAESLVAHPFHAAMEALSAHPWPTVAMINGHCLGGGLELAVTCDMRICAAGAKLGMPPAKLGLIYGHTGLRKFLDTIGLPRTKELFLTGRNVEAARAEQIGLVHEVFADERPRERRGRAGGGDRGQRAALDARQQTGDRGPERQPGPHPGARRPSWSRCASPASAPTTSARASRRSPRSGARAGLESERAADRKALAATGPEMAALIERVGEDRPRDPAAAAERGGAARRLRGAAAGDRRPAALDESGAHDLRPRPRPLRRPHALARGTPRGERGGPAGGGPVRVARSSTSATSPPT